MSKVVELLPSELFNVLSNGFTITVSGAKEFLDFRKEGDIILIENVMVKGKAILGGSGRNNSTIEFKNVLFDEMILSDKIFGGPLQFTNCEFEGNVSINGTFTGGLHIHNCIFRGNISIGNSAQCHLSCINCRFEKGFQINNSYQTVSLRENSINEFKMLGAVNELDLSKNTVGQMQLLGGTYANTKMTENSVEDLKLRNTSLNNISISALDLSNKLEIFASTIDNLLIEDLTGPGTIQLELNCFNRTLIQYSFFDRLALTSSLPNDKSLTVLASEIRYLSFIDAKILGNCRLIELDIPETGRLSLVNCDLGKTNFLRCNFRNCEFEFENSKVPEIFLAETDFPKKVVIGNKPNYHQAQLVFGQLQNTYQKQGDSIRTNEYLAREVEAHYYTLPWFEKRFHFKRNGKFKSLPWLSKNFFTKLSLFLNKWSNDFGRNWSRGVVFSFGMGLLFFYFLLLSTDEYYFTITPHFKSNLVAPFLKFMNPLRHFETQNLFSESSTVTLEPKSYIIDFLARIFVAYGFYQTIQAFRRYGKK